ISTVVPARAITMPSAGDSENTKGE
ncbi:MAG TPA: RNA chaperone Hfq, partial [Alteromonas mediterranea]|nr:RNA chaperone Hfq [Alteromonas mediterranea]